MKILSYEKSVQLFASNAMVIWFHLFYFLEPKSWLKQKNSIVKNFSHSPKTYDTSWIAFKSQIPF